MKKYDVAIIGAGPCGLFQVFELGLMGLNACVFDSLPKLGGQCAELYPDKPIYDIPAVPSIDAGELHERLLEQIEPFGAEYFLDQKVVGLQEEGNDFIVVSTKTAVKVKAVVIAAGAGGFVPRKPNVPGDDVVKYKVTDPESYAEKNVLVLGGGDSAFDWAYELWTHGAYVTLLHRSMNYKAAPATVEKYNKVVESGEALLETGSVKEIRSHGTGSLVTVSSGGMTKKMETDHILCFFGMNPDLKFLKDWNLELSQGRASVDTSDFQTSRPGVYAVGDCNFYPGKKKLILSGFHEAALAAFSIKERITGKVENLAYTTTSTKLHGRLKVEDPYAEEKKR